MFAQGTFPKAGAGHCERIPARVLSWVSRSTQAYRLAEVGFLLLLIARVWLAASEFLDPKKVGRLPESRRGHRAGGQRCASNHCHALGPLRLNDVKWRRLARFWLDLSDLQHVPVGVCEVHLLPRPG